MRRVTAQLVYFYQPIGGWFWNGPRICISDTKTMRYFLFPVSVKNCQWSLYNMVTTWPVIKIPFWNYTMIQRTKHLTTLVVAQNTYTMILNKYNTIRHRLPLSPVSQSLMSNSPPMTMHYLIMWPDRWVMAQHHVGWSIARMQILYLPPPLKRSNYVNSTCKLQ
jgi:hypothetical protein